jgi:hypothetical protein
VLHKCFKSLPASDVDLQFVDLVYHCTFQAYGLFAEESSSTPAPSSPPSSLPSPPLFSDLMFWLTQLPSRKIHDIATHRWDHALKYILLNHREALTNTREPSYHEMHLSRHLKDSTQFDWAVHDKIVSWLLATAKDAIVKQDSYQSAFVGMNVLTIVLTNAYSMTSVVGLPGLQQELVADSQQLSQVAWVVENNILGHAISGVCATVGPPASSPAAASPSPPPSIVSHDVEYQKRLSGIFSLINLCCLHMRRAPVGAAPALPEPVTVDMLLTTDCVSKLWDSGFSAGASPTDRTRTANFFKNLLDLASINNHPAYLASFVLQLFDFCSAKLNFRTMCGECLKVSARGGGEGVARERRGSGERAARERRGSGEGAEREWRGGEAPHTQRCEREGPRSGGEVPPPHTAMRAQRTTQRYKVARGPPPYPPLPPHTPAPPTS